MRSYMFIYEKYICVHTYTTYIHALTKKKEREGDLIVDEIIPTLKKVRKKDTFSHHRL